MSFYFKKASILAFLLVHFIHLQALGNFPSPVDISQFYDDSLLYINQYTRVLKTQHAVPVDSVHYMAEMGLFQKVGDKPVIFNGYDEYHYWFCIPVSNSGDKPVEMLLLLGQLGIREGNLYQYRDGNMLHIGKTGYRYDFNERPYLFAHHVFPFTVQPKQTDTLYLTTDESHAFRITALAFIHPKLLKSIEAKFYFTFGIILGILSLFCFFNIYLFITSKEKLHLWYAFYIFIQMLLILKHEGLDAQFFGMDSEHGYRMLGMGGLGILSLGLLIHVLQLFFGSGKDRFYRVLNKFVTVLKWWLIVMAVVHFISFYVQPPFHVEYPLFQLVYYSTPFGLLFILIYCVCHVYKGSKPGWLILLGLFIYLIGGLERTLQLTTSNYIFPPSLFEIGIAVESVVISFGLMYRYQLDRREKEKAYSELRLQKIKEAQKIIEAQESERKRIAEDIHDDLGGNLALLKLHLQSLASDELQKQSLLTLLDKTSSHVRQVAHGLMPPEFLNTDFIKVLKAYIHQLNKEYRIFFSLVVIGENSLRSKEQEIMVYRIIMELCSNILKHSKAGEATVQLIFDNDMLELTIEDDGVGLKEDLCKGIGLKNVESRITYLNGSLHMDSNKNGTTFIINIPCKYEKGKDSYSG